VLILSPLAPLSVGFWLSFGAVATIIYGCSARINPHGLWWKWGRAQWVIAAGLSPLLLLFFQQASLVSVLANLIAIPFVGFLVVPLSLVGALLTLVYQPLAQLCLWVAAKAMSVIWLYLTSVAALPGALWQHSVANGWVMFSAIVGVILLLAPKGFSLRAFGWVWLMPLVFYQPPGPTAGRIWLTLLDVGQGLSAVVRTQHHVLVYDTGPKTSSDFDTGQAVVVPYLREQGINKINELMISHGDNDHIGGAKSVLKLMKVDRVLTSVPKRFAKGIVKPCIAGQHWQWDGVSFQKVLCYQA